MICSNTHMYIYQVERTLIRKQLMSVAKYHRRCRVWGDENRYKSLYI